MPKTLISTREKKEDEKYRNLGQPRADNINGDSLLTFQNQKYNNNIK